MIFPILYVEFRGVVLNSVLFQDLAETENPT